MRDLIKQIIQVRCNFCFNWINAPNLVKGHFNSCMGCFAQHLNIITIIHTPEGDNYNLCFSQDIKPAQIKDLVQDNPIVQEVSEEMDQSPLKDKQQQLMAFDDHRCKSVSSQLMDIKMSQIQHPQTQNMREFARILNQATTISQFLDKKQEEGLKPHQSCVFNSPISKKVRENFFSSYKKMSKLEDLSRSLDKTRFLQRYQFYHDQNAIQSFIEIHPKIDERSYRSKQFGNQINFNDINRSINTKSRFENSKSHRSRLSNESTQKMQGEQVKQKISCFLESKYHSESLTKLMTTYLEDAYNKTTIQNHTLELKNYKISSLDLRTYLSMFDFDTISIIKLINVDLTDLQIPALINFIWDKSIQSLDLIGNKLTENCIDVFLSKGLPNLKELYLGNNRINKIKMKQNVSELQSRFILFL